MYSYTKAGNFKNTCIEMLGYLVIIMYVKYIAFDYLIIFIGLDLFRPLMSLLLTRLH